MSLARGRSVSVRCVCESRSHSSSHHRRPVLPWRLQADTRGDTRVQATAPTERARQLPPSPSVLHHLEADRTNLYLKVNVDIVEKVSKVQ